MSHAEASSTAARRSSRMPRCFVPKEVCFLDHCEVIPNWPAALPRLSRLQSFRKTLFRATPTGIHDADADGKTYPAAQTSPEPSAAGALGLAHSSGTSAPSSSRRQASDDGVAVAEAARSLGSTLRAKLWRKASYTEGSGRASTSTGTAGAGAEAPPSGRVGAAADDPQQTGTGVERGTGVTRSASADEGAGRIAERGEGPVRPVAVRHALTFDAATGMRDPTRFDGALHSPRLVPTSSDHAFVGAGRREPLNASCVCTSCESAMREATTDAYEPRWSLGARRKYLSGLAHQQALAKQALVTEACDSTEDRTPSARNSIELAREKGGIDPTNTNTTTTATAGSPDSPDDVDLANEAAAGMRGAGLPDASQAALDVRDSFVVGSPSLLVDRGGTSSPWDESLEMDLRDELAAIAERDRRRRASEESCKLVGRPGATSAGAGGGGGGARAMMRQLEEADRRERRAELERESRRSSSASARRDDGGATTSVVPMGAPVRPTTTRAWTPPMRIGSPEAREHAALQAAAQRRAASPLSALLRRRSPSPLPSAALATPTPPPPPMAYEQGAQEVLPGSKTTTTRLRGREAPPPTPPPPRAASQTPPIPPSSSSRRRTPSPAAAAAAAAAHSHPGPTSSLPPPPRSHSASPRGNRSRAYGGMRSSPMTGITEGEDD